MTSSLPSNRRETRFPYTGNRILSEAPPFDLSSRPKRSEVEGPAVRQSQSTKAKESVPLPIFHPDRAKRSGVPALSEVE